MTSEEVQNLSEIEKLLKKNIGREILIKLKNNITVNGKLRIFDQHMNLTLKKGTISGEIKEDFEDLLIRGSDILVVILLEIPRSKDKY